MNEYVIRCNNISTNYKSTCTLYSTTSEKIHFFLSVWMLRSQKRYCTHYIVFTFMLHHYCQGDHSQFCHFIQHCTKQVKTFSLSLFSSMHLHHINIYLYPPSLRFVIGNGIHCEQPQIFKVVVHSILSI